MVDPIVTPPHPPVSTPQPLPPTVALNPPMVGTASPFERVDGQNRDLILEAIRAWARGPLFEWAGNWQRDLIAWLDDTENWLDTWNAEIVRYVQDVLDAVINNSIELQDAVLAGAIDDPESATRVSLDAIYASIPEVNGIAQRVTAVETRLDWLRVPVEVFGAVGDGVADDSDALDAALSSGKKLLGGFGKTYRTTRTIGLGATDVDMVATGSTFIADHQSNVIQTNGAISEVIPVNGFTQAYELTAVSGGTINVVTIDMMQNAPADWSVGDIVMMASDDIIPYTKDAATGNTVQNRCGEFLTVVSVNGTQLKASGRIDDASVMVTSLRVAKWGSRDKFKWVGGIFDFTDDAYDTGNGYTFWVNRHIAPVIRDATFMRVKSAAVAVKACYQWVVDNVSVIHGVNDLTRSAFGYGVANFNSAYGKLSNSYFQACRHSYTNGGTYTSVGTMQVDGSGRPHDTTIENCDSVNASATGFDSHTQGRRERFVNCHVHNSSGFGLRGTFHTVKDCSVTGGTNAVIVFIESTGDRSYGHTIDGLNVQDVQSILLATVNKRAGGVFENVKELDPIVIKNVTGRGLRGRAMIGDNTTVHASGFDIANLPASTAIASLFSNSDIVWCDSNIRSNRPLDGALISFAINGHPNPKQNISLENIHMYGSFNYVAEGTTTGSGFRAVNVQTETPLVIGPLQAAYSKGDTPAPVVFP